MTHEIQLLKIIKADARQLSGLVSAGSVDLVVTSPPYWECRDYEHPQQIGHENTPEAYIEALLDAINNWRTLLSKHASIFINIGDVFRRGSLVGIPALFEIAARKHGWLIVNRIIWSKNRGRPEPQRYRLANRYEYVFQIALTRHFYFDLYALEQHLGLTGNPGDVWRIEPIPSKSNHMAPFPPELARRAILAACPERICPECRKPHTRQLEPDMNLPTERKQAQRALAIYKDSDLTEEHLAAVRAVGISDTGKGRQLQNGATKNAARTLELANEAKLVLGGYFREFTFAPKRQVGWQICDCGVEPCPGTVLDPFMGSGTTLRVANELGRNALGADLMPPESL